MMQTSKPAKKPGFKCPAFSVPSKPKDDKKAKTEASPAKKKCVPTVKKVSEDKVPLAPLQQPTSSGENASTDDLQVVPDAVITEAGDRLSDCQEKDADQKEEKNEKPINESITEKNDSDPIQEKNVVKKKKPTEFKMINKTGTDVTVHVAAGERSSVASGSQVKEKNKKEKKQKPISEKKSETTRKEKTSKPKTETMPVRSYTDEEYEELFSAVLQHAEHFDIDNWQPKLTSPVKVREPVKKKYSITVGKKERAENQGNCSQEDPLPPKPDTEAESKEASDDNGKEVEPKNQDDEAEDLANDDADEPANEAIDNNSDDEAVPEAEDDLLVAGDHRASSVQQENETTPAVSEVDFNTKPAPQAHSPPPKKKLQPKKKAQLEPKELPFQEKENMASSTIDQVKNLKKKNVEKRKMKEFHANKTQKKTKLESKSHDNEMKKPHKEKKHARPEKTMKKVNKKKKMQERELALEGTWVQCCNSDCQKWRHLADIHDPSTVPDRWTCSLNTDPSYNSCDKAEENYDEDDHIYTKFTEGSVIWAKMTGYPWWPAMVEIDPDCDTFFSVESENSMVPTHYHVVFFDERVSRCWVKAANICHYTGNEEADGIFITPKKGHSYTKEIKAAKKNANRALICTLKERIELFGFAARFNGVWQSKPVVKGRGKDSKRKEPKAFRKPVCSLSADLLDDDTMDEVLDNAEELLENVDDLLESLASELSDEDSNFSAEELVVVEKKRKKTGRASAQRLKQQKHQDAVQSNSEIDDDKSTTSQDKTGHPEQHRSETQDSTQLRDPDSDVNDENLEDNETVQREPDNSTATKHGTKLELDPEIFTMEIGDTDEDDIILTVSKKASIVYKHKGKKNNDEDENKVIMDSKKLIEDKNACNVIEETQSESMTKSKPKKQGKGKPKDCKHVNSKDEKEDRNRGREGEMDIVENVEKEKNKSDILDTNDDNDEFDGDADIENIETAKENEDNDEDEFDMNVKDETVSNTATGANENGVSVGLEEDSGDEFSLVDQSLYDDKVTGDDKVIERNVSPVLALPVVEAFSDEDSDPFDLMEE